MCYNLVYMTKKKLDYARRMGATEEELSELEQQLRHYEELDGRPPMFHADGFAHPDLPVITNQEPDKIQFFEWGLIPNEFWVDDLNLAVKRQRNNLNARGETMFKKPSWRKAAKRHRCLVLVDGYFDYYHFKGKKYPFYIRMKNDEPFTMAGLYAIKAFKQEGIVKKTVAIVTCDPNPLMAKIHNNPASSSEPRMPVILPRDLQQAWLKPITDVVDQAEVQEFIKPYDDQEMFAYTVRRLKGKQSVSNGPEKLEEFMYEELEYPI